MVCVTPLTTPPMAGSNRMPVMPALTAHGYCSHAFPSGAAIGRDEHPGGFSPRIDDVGVVGIDGHLLADLAVAVVGIVRRLLREGGLRPRCSLVGAFEHVTVILHVKDVCIAVGNLDFVDALAAG